MVAVVSLPRLRSLHEAHSCSEPGTSICTTKKRRRLNEILKEPTAHAEANQRGRPRGRPRDPNKVSLTVTHEIRMLRAQVAYMENELQDLQIKWTKQLPDERLLTTAHQSIREKHAALRAERTHGELQQLLRQQQVLFATLQTAVLHAPLHSSGIDILEALHFDTQLGYETEEREQMLLAHNERSLATIPSFVNKFSQLAIEKALAKQEENVGDKSVLPLSQIDVTGCKDHTLISSVFVSEIPHTSLEEVYTAVLAYFDAIPCSMKRYFGINTKRTRLNSAESLVVYRRTTFNASEMNTAMNNIVCSELTASHGMVHIDIVNDDPIHPVPVSASSKYGICGLTITPRKEPVTGKTLSVTLRWIVLYRYNMLPSESAIRQDLEIARPIMNGDMITASVCSYLQQHQKMK